MNPIKSLILTVDDSLGFISKILIFLFIILNCIFIEPLKSITFNILSSCLFTFLLLYSLADLVLSLSSTLSKINMFESLFPFEYMHAVNSLLDDKYSCIIKFFFLLICIYFFRSSCKYPLFPAPIFFYKHWKFVLLPITNIVSKF